MQNDYNQLKQEKERLLLALRVAGSCVFEMEIPSHNFIYFENADVIFGISSRQLLEDLRTLRLIRLDEHHHIIAHYFMHPDDLDVDAVAFQKAVSGNPASYYARMHAGNCTFKWCKVNFMPIIENNTTVRILGIITDVDEMKLNVERSEEKTHFDNFTGLLNKKYGEICIRQALSSYPNSMHALIFLDLDNFKQLNDNYGHDVGDQVLSQISQQLQDVFSPADIISRFGGDEFLIFLANIPDREFLEDILLQLQEAHPTSPFVTKSIGAAIYPQHGRSYQQLFQKADAAMYIAKKRKNRYYISE